MARQINRLNARKLPESPGRHADGNGLYLYVKDTGARTWLLRYHVGGKRREMGLGSVANVTLATAREKVRDLQQKLSQGIDPLARAGGEITFGAVAVEYIEALKPHWKSVKHGQQWTNTLTTHASNLWSLPVDAITTEDVLKALSPIWAEKAETAGRVRGRIERVLDAAKVRGLRDGDNPARWKGHLSVLLPKRKTLTRGHRRAMPYSDLPTFIAELRKREAVSARALEFLILTAARHGEVRRSVWSEFDVEGKLWTVPAARMKGSKEHRVPLVDRAVALLEHVRFLNPNEPFNFSDTAMKNLMGRMGWNDYDIHGFRSSFRDWAGDKTDYPREVIEAALAHLVGNAVERAYRRGDALDKRRELMEAWATYLG